jgi:hypothetical protein
MVEMFEKIKCVALNIADSLLHKNSNYQLISNPSVFWLFIIAINNFSLPKFESVSVEGSLQHKPMAACICTTMAASVFGCRVFGGNCIYQQCL